MILYLIVRPGWQGMRGVPPLAIARGKRGGEGGWSGRRLRHALLCEDFDPGVQGQEDVAYFVRG